MAKRVKTDAEVIAEMVAYDSEPAERRALLQEFASEDVEIAERLLGKDAPLDRLARLLHNTREVTQRWMLEGRLDALRTT